MMRAIIGGAILGVGVMCLLILGAFVGGVILPRLIGISPALTLIGILVVIGAVLGAGYGALQYVPPPTRR